MHRRQFSLLLTVAMMVATAGCFGGSSVKMYPVKGKVTYKGNAVAGATVTFHPKERDKAKYQAAQGITKDDGTFVMGTKMSGDGVMAGDFVITIVKRKSDAPTGGSAPVTMGIPGATGDTNAAGNGDMYSKMMVNRGGNQAAKAAEQSDEIPAQYASPDKTDKFVTIGDGGPSEVNLDL